MDARSNPFLKPVTPAQETDVDQNAVLFEKLLGPEEADRYRALVAGENRQPRQKTTDIRARAKEALMSQQGLLDASLEKQTEHFLTIELKQKFDTQVESLRAAEFLETNEQGELGVLGIDGKFYPLPTSEQVVQYFSTPQRKIFFVEKVLQGFTRVLITPFASSIDVLSRKTGEFINKQDAEGKIHAEDASDFHVDQAVPSFVSNKIIDADVFGDLVYDVTKFKSADHSGKTKAELLNDPSQPFPGFRVQLLQEDLTTPIKEGAVIVNERQNIEAGKSPKDCLRILQTDPLYQGERGLTPEDWFALFVTNLNETGVLIDDFSIKNNYATNLIGCMLKISRTNQEEIVPNAYWGRFDGRAGIRNYYTDTVDNGSGVRTAVG